MKKIFLGAFSMLMIAGLLSTTSCKKGDAGPQGEKGDSAMANVYYSTWAVPSWGFTTDDEDELGAEIAAPKLTADVINKGAIHVYLNRGTDAAPIVEALPFSAVASDGTGLYISPVFTAGSIVLFTNTNVGLPNTTTGAVGKYRYILIPGGTPARTSGKNIDWNNYAEVKAYLGLKD